MSQKPFFLLLTSSLLTLATAGYAQTSRPAVRPIGAIEYSTGAQFLYRNGEVVLFQNKSYKALTQNVRLVNGTKINYKSGIVELPGGKMTTLHEGDYVTSAGNIVFATPSSAAAARHDSTAAKAARFEQYVERGQVLSTTDLQTRLNNMNRQISLMEQKIKLLNQKISMFGNTPNPPDTRELDQQINALNEQLRTAR